MQIYVFVSINLLNLIQIKNTNYEKMYRFRNSNAVFSFYECPRNKDTKD